MADDARDKWTTFHFSQSNPNGVGEGDVAALLRRVADSIDDLGDVSETLAGDPSALSRCMRRRRR
jgi:hypothetical protein